MSNDFGDVRAQIREQIEKLNTWVLIQDVETISGETLRGADVLPDLRNCPTSDESLSGTIAELKSMLLLCVLKSMSVWPAAQNANSAAAGKTRR